ncbi:MAG: hypothetical protein V1895_01890 [Parcubacteria group bacterium]
MAKHKREDLVVLQFAYDTDDMEVVALEGSKVTVYDREGAWSGGWHVGYSQLVKHRYPIGSARFLGGIKNGVVGVYDRTNLKHLLGMVRDACIITRG